MLSLHYYPALGMIFTLTSIQGRVVFIVGSPLPLLPLIVGLALPLRPLSRDAQTDYYSDIITAVCLTIVKTEV
jgi:hypothetical protein